MVGIYKIQNKLNGKIYIGQSNNCERRIKEHCCPSRYLGNLPIDVAIHKHGKENFDFDIIEECSLEQLNERETYWILYFNSHTEAGYNCNIGGDSASVGENNGNSKITKEDVIQIRLAYQNHKSKKETYKIVEDKISFGTFEKVWEGLNWSHIMPEVFTEENKKYYTTGEGCINNNAYTNEEVLFFRKQYITKTAKEIFNSLENPKITYQSFQKMLNGNTYKHLPYYAKTHGQWFDQEHPAPKVSEKRGQHLKRTNLFTDEEVMTFRKEYVNATARDIYEQYQLHEKISLDSFSKLLRGVNYKHLPYYSKTQQQWIKQ